MDLSCLPENIVYIIMRFVFHGIHNNRYKHVLDQYKGFILDEADMGTTILRRIEGMPLLEEIP